MVLEGVPEPGVRRRGPLPYAAPPVEVPWSAAKRPPAAPGRRILVPRAAARAAANLENRILRSMRSAKTDKRNAQEDREGTG